MWATSLLMVALVAAGIIALLVLRFAVNTRSMGTIKASASRHPTRARITAIVPARNEEEDLEAAIRALLAQRDVDLDVILINDHSTDRTGKIANALAAEDRRVRVIHDPPLADGWMGKINAMETARREATGEFLFFSDADVIHEPAALATGLELMSERSIEFLSLMPRLECVGFWENVLLPSATLAGFAQLGSGVNDPESSAAVAAGAYMLTRRESMNRAGGFAPIRRHVLDDVELFRLFKSQGFSAAFHLAPTLGRVRLFKDTRHAFWGMTKNVLAITFDHVWMAIPALLMVPTIAWGPLVALGAGIVSGNASLVAAGALGPAIHVLGLIAVRPMCRYRWSWAILFPLAVLPSVACLVRAFYLRVFRGRTEWRGRQVALKAEG